MFGGTATQTSTGRWGDYSMTTADPSDNMSFGTLTNTQLAARTGSPASESSIS